jgi:hypothetical protein
MENRYYKHMNIGMDWVLKDPEFLNKLEPTVKDKFTGHWQLELEDISDQYLQWLDQHNLTIRFSELFYCFPGGNIFLHIDDIYMPDGCKMNWVYDHDETWMRFFKLKEGRELKEYSSTIGSMYYTANEGDYEYADQVRVGKPTLVNAYHLHDIINPSKFPRWCVSVVPQFKDKLESRLMWDEAMILFADYFRS